MLLPCTYPYKKKESQKKKKRSLLKKVRKVAATFVRGLCQHFVDTFHAWISTQSSALYLIDMPVCPGLQGSKRLPGCALDQMEQDGTPDCEECGTEKRSWDKLGGDLGGGCELEVGRPPPPFHFHFQYSSQGLLLLRTRPT